MRLRNHFLNLLMMLMLAVGVTACDPMAPQPTARIIIVSNTPTTTPVPSPTVVTPTRTPAPTRTLVPTVAATVNPCPESSGQVIPYNRNPSTIADENLRYRVYIPPCYTTSQKRYPVVYLLHGQASTESQWQDIGAVDTLNQGIAVAALPPMILVMPFWGVIGNTNTFPPDPSYETIVLDELMPAIERDFCTINDRQHRAIGGISRGGFWAYSIGLRHPDVFGIIGGHSAAFPSDNREVPPAFNPLDLAINSSLLPDAELRMYIDNAAQDIVGTELQQFSSQLSSRGITHSYIINPTGDHSNDYWSTHISEYLAFYGRDWEKNTSALPSCLTSSP